MGTASILFWCAVAAPAGFATAVQTSVLGTCSAGFYGLFPQCLQQFRDSVGQTVFGDSLHADAKMGRLDSYLRLL
jgi:hypothetical protein